MSDLIVRRLLIDLQAPIDTTWCGGDAFRTAFFNSFGGSFVVGEQMFIDAVRDAYAELPEAEHRRLAADVAGFVGQEATHRRIHGLFNAHLERQGWVNAWQARSLQRVEELNKLGVRPRLAVTIAYEHFTAILAGWLLHNPQLLDGAEDRLRTMWLWHACEETEHRSVAFEMYRTAGGTYGERLVWFGIVTFYLATDAARQTLSDLRRQKALWKWSTVKSAARVLLGKRGVVRQCGAAWFSYFSRDFHPDVHDGADALAARWLAEHAAHYTELQPRKVL